MNMYLNPLAPDPKLRLENGAPTQGAGRGALCSLLGAQADPAAPCSLSPGRNCHGFMLASALVFVYEIRFVQDACAKFVWGVGS